MIRLQNKELKLFRQIFKMSPKKLQKNLYSILSKHYDKIVSTDDYLYAVGDIPIALVAHMDTVFQSPPSEIFYDREQNVIWSPQGLGADDRAGVFAILYILTKHLKPHIIFTQNEEMGCLGASALSDIKCPFSDLKYIIELDRRGAIDCVFYDCESPAFSQYIEDFGFISAYGSFSDISELAPAWGVAAVNLSIGYRDEHSRQEILYVGQMFETIHKVINMLKNSPEETFKFIGYPYCFHTYSLKCGKCGKKIQNYEGIPIVGKNSVTKFYCPDCIAEDKDIDWCMNCFVGYEKGIMKDGELCPICQSKGFGTTEKDIKYYGKNWSDWYDYD